ncbi:MAG: protein translocase subunit SecF, partial [Proteobacteria bacterium]|nr:protein translocase subunit SecF [Pseudomonadota bacterium]
MQFFKNVTNIDFLGRQKNTFVFSIVLIVCSIASLGVRGLNLGIDFTGGTLVELAYERSVNPSDIRTTLSNAGIEDGVVQYFGTSKDILIRLPVDPEQATAEQSSTVVGALRDEVGE